MELKDFISKTIVEICEGIRDAQGATRKLTNNTPIAPAYLDGRSVLSKADDRITFDVSVSFSEASEKHKGGGVKIQVINADVDRVSSSSTETTNRIQFSVPYYPQALNAYEGGKL